MRHHHRRQCRCQNECFEAVEEQSELLFDQLLVALQDFCRELGWKEDLEDVQTHSKTQNLKKHQRARRNRDVSASSYRDEQQKRKEQTLRHCQADEASRQTKDHATGSANRRRPHSTATYRAHAVSPTIHCAVQANLSGESSNKSKYSHELCFLSDQYGGWKTADVPSQP